MMISAELLRELLSYEPDTGLFRWKVRKGARALAGARAGSVSGSGYRYIRIAGRDYRGNRLAWLYMNGEWPARDVEHRDRDKLNNKWGNLRLATDSQNIANTPPYRNNQSGLKGAYQRKGSGDWYSSIRVSGQTRYLGTFYTAEAAHRAYAEAANGAFGEFARVA